MLLPSYRNCNGSHYVQSSYENLEKISRGGISKYQNFKGRNIKVSICVALYYNNNNNTIDAAWLLIRNWGGAKPFDVVPSMY